MSGNVVQPQIAKRRRNGASAIGGEDDNLFRSFGAMLTWNGPWLADSVVLADLIQQLRNQPDDLAAKVSELPEVTALMDQFWQEMLEFKKTFLWPHMSCCMELSLKAEASCRVHFHMFAEFSDCTRIANSMRDIKFNNVRCAYLAPTMAQRGPKGRDRAVREGHYYV